MKCRKLKIAIHTYILIREAPKCGAGTKLCKMGGVKSQPFGSSVANGNGTHKKKIYKAASTLV